MTFENPSVKSNKKNPLVQTKLTIGEPDDQYEQEADAVADQLMRMPEAPLPIQRKCEDCEEEQLQMKPLQTSTTPLQIQKKDQFYEKTREYNTDGEVPTSFNYELKNHQLIAHTVSISDVDKIIEMVRILGIYSGQNIDEESLRKQLSSQRDGVDENVKKDIDVTTFLPAPMQKFLSGLEKYYSMNREYAAENGPRDKIFEDMPEFTDERTEKLKEWDSKSPSHKPEYDLWHAVCHEFASISIGGAAKGQADKGMESLNMAEVDTAVAAYDSSINGKGPYRIVSPKDVRVGDIAVFKAGKIEASFPSHAIIHSAIIIKVAGEEVELLEKKNPHKPMATRTVDAVLKKYAGNKAVVHYLSPALAGMPTEKSKNLGNVAPSESFTSDQGNDAKDKEGTHVLFMNDSNLLKAHEDLKLFQFIIANKDTKFAAKVHGYASEEGDETYNLNLSAHRALSVKNGLTLQLPNSTIEAIAHGETTVFGSNEANRRAGIELVGAQNDGSSGEDSELKYPPLIPSSNFSLDRLGELEKPLLFQFPLFEETNSPCSFMPKFPDYSGLLFRLNCDIQQNLKDNKHHFELTQGLEPERNDLLEKQFFRYFAGANVLETLLTFYGTDADAAQQLPYIAGGFYKIVQLGTSGILELDIPYEVGKYKFELNLDIAPKSEQDHSVGEWKLFLGFGGKY